MIRKSFLVAAILLLFHMLYIRVSRYPDYLSQHQWQGNVIKAQKYLYGKNVKYIIVGSSLSNLLLKDSLPEFANLAFAGQSIYDGFEIVKRKSIQPAFLFIETNFVLREPNEKFVSSIIADAPYFLNEKVPSLRDQFQPVSMLGNKIILPFVNWTLARTKPKVAGNKNGKSKEDEAAFQKLIDIQAKAFNSPTEDSVIRNKMLVLKKWVSYFRQQNVIVVFYEMPVNGRLKNLEVAKKTRDAFHVYFPEPDYLYLEDFSFSSMQTTDGIHLDPPSARIASGYFKNEAQQLFSMLLLQSR